MGEPPALSQAENQGLEPRALGLVDELDDPAPGHMSDHPTALTTTTTVGPETGARPLFGSLEERFVKPEGEGSQPEAGNAQAEQTPGDQFAMELDADNEDKENKA
jgi:serine/threonine-protein phosphatase 4 regulatory subunit 2